MVKRRMLWMRRGGKRRMRRLERHAELEEFDALLDQSSLGTPTAKAIQALDSPGGHRRREPETKKGAL
jgi:hypothetical protein